MTIPDPNRNLRQAGTVALWVWGLLGLVLLLCVGCCLFGPVLAGGSGR